MQLHAKELLPVDLVFSPQWWNKQTGMTFDRDFFFHPSRRVEDERKMEQHLYEKWGHYGMGSDRKVDRPEIGAVHLASGYLLSQMTGCKVDYHEAAPPNVNCLYMDSLDTRLIEGAFESHVFKDFYKMREELKTRFGYVTGDVNWSGILNVALDLRGQDLFIDMIEEPEKCASFISSLADMVEKFTDDLQGTSNSTSISVNRTVRHFDEPVLLHSECSLTMVSEDIYQEYLLPYDLKWSRKNVPFGIHYCGSDPHRFAKAFSLIPNLAFLDLGFGGDVSVLRSHLPNAFLNLRLSPVELAKSTIQEIKETIYRLVHSSGSLYLTGLCCINIDDTVNDENVSAIFEARKELLDLAGGHRRSTT